MFAEERALWLYQHFRWLEAELPVRERSERVLVVPTKTFFPDPFHRDHVSAERVFERTKDLLEMSDWNCVLTQQLDPDAEVGEALRIAGIYGEYSKKGAVGTFSASESVEITYAPDLLKDPPGLVATFAHELSHYLLATLEVEPPCGWDELEPLTDLTAVVEGFGVFLCNSAFQFSGWNDGFMQGWSSSRRGYLSEAELGFSLGIFCVRNKVDPKLAAVHLKPNPRHVFADSLDFIEDLEREDRSAQPGATDKPAISEASDNSGGDGEGR